MGLTSSTEGTIKMSPWHGNIRGSDGQIEESIPQLYANETIAKSRIAVAKMRSPTLPHLV